MLSVDDFGHANIGNEHRTVDLMVPDDSTSLRGLTARILPAFMCPHSQCSDHDARSLVLSASPRRRAVSGRRLNVVCRYPDLSSARAGAREGSCVDFGVAVWDFNPKPE
jgi:hypothetical protein